MPPPAGQDAARKYTPDDWEEHREEIAAAYENGTLGSVMQSMTQQHGLEATPKQYKDRIKKWGLNKHIQKDEMEAMIRIRQERKMTDNKETAFLLRGRPVNDAKIDRYEKEHGDMDVDMGEIPMPTPSDISFTTPKNAVSPTPQDAPSPQSISKPKAGAIPESTIPSSATSGGYQESHGYGYSQPPPLQRPYGYSQPPPQQYGGYGGVPPSQHKYGRPGTPSTNSNAYVNRNLAAPPPPPTQMQAFGNGAPQGYAFQYSACTGRRKALLIGINYFGQRGQLRGCINDVKNMSAFLHECFGYQRDDMVILTDDQQNPMSQPTKQNILRAMHWLVKDARPNDSLFFHYSGHGGQTKDLDGDEEDGYDEVIYPVDFRTTGHIVDEEMHRILVTPLTPGVRLTAIFDSCHSGTALDLPYIYSTQGVLKEPNLAKEAGQGLVGVISSYSQRTLGGVASQVMGCFKKAINGDDAYNKNMNTKTSAADVVMWSGSKDDQTSADATIAAQATGALSWAFIAAMKKNPQQSYCQLLNSIRDELAQKYTQKPQLSCSHPLNTNLLFVM